MIKKITLQEVEKIAELHQTNIKEAFFSKLGKNFLIYLYTAYFKYYEGKNFLGYYYVDENRYILGFITCSLGKNFFSKFIYNNFFNLIFNVSLGIIKNPISIISLLQTINCLIFDDIKEESEIFSIAVEEGHRDKKIGKALLESLFEELKNQNIQNLKVLVDTSIPANFFYQKNGFKLAKTLGFMGRKINVYRLQISNET